MLASFYRPGTSNGPTEALDGRLEHARGPALGFRNLTNYITRSLLETGASGRNHALDHEVALSLTYGDIAICWVHGTGRHYY